MKVKQDWRDVLRLAIAERNRNPGPVPPGHEPQNRALDADELRQLAREVVCIPNPWVERPDIEPRQGWVLIRLTDGEET